MTPPLQAPLPSGSRQVLGLHRLRSGAGSLSLIGSFCHDGAPTTVGHLDLPSNLDDASRDTTSPR